MSYYGWGTKDKIRLRLPGTDPLHVVAHEIGKFIGDNLVNQGLTELFGPDGTVYDLEISVALVPAQPVEDNEISEPSNQGAGGV